MARFRYVDRQDDSSPRSDELSGVWAQRGPLVPLFSHRPQSQPNQHRTWSAQNERDLGGSPIESPSVSLRRSKRRSTELVDTGDDSDFAVQERDPYKDTQYPSPTGGFPWFKAICVIVLAHLLGQYGPAAPPVESGSHTWGEFWQRELEVLSRSAMLIGYTVPKYCMEWVAVGLYDDMLFSYHQYQRQAEEKAMLEKWSNCSLKIPTEWNLEYESGSSQMGDWYHIAGQTRAVEVTTAALDAWEQSAPLLLYFAGAPAVGKLELAKQISLRVFGHCLRSQQMTSTELFRGSSGPLLMLQGRNYANHGETKNQDTGKLSFRKARVELYESILKHVQNHPNGTIIVLHHVEEMREGLLATLVQDLVSPSRHSSTEDEQAVASHDYNSAQSLALRLQQACGKAVFVLTSREESITIGNFIHRWGGGSKVPDVLLYNTLKDEVDVRYATKKPGSTKQAFVDVGSKFHALAPFYNLEEPTMMQILAQKASQWQPQKHESTPAFKRFSMTKHSLKVLVDPNRLEYYDAPSISFSNYGAQELTEGGSLMNKWQASVKRCLKKSGVPSGGDIEEIKSDNQMLAKNIVLDYDTATSKGLVLFCPPHAMQHDTNGIAFLSVDGTKCEEICRIDL